MFLFPHTFRTELAQGEVERTLATLLNTGRALEMLRGVDLFNSGGGPVYVSVGVKEVEVRTSVLFSWLYSWQPVIKVRGITSSESVIGRGLGDPQLQAAAKKISEEVDLELGRIQQSASRQKQQMSEAASRIESLLNSLIEQAEKGNEENCFNLFQALNNEVFWQVNMNPALVVDGLQVMQTALAMLHSTTDGAMKEAIQGWIEQVKGAFKGLLVSRRFGWKQLSIRTSKLVAPKDFSGMLDASLVVRHLIAQANERKRRFKKASKHQQTATERFLDFSEREN